MKLIRIFAGAFICVLPIFATAQAEKEVKDLLQQQVSAWNAGDLEGFMQTYWKSDSLLMIGKSGLHYGWQRVLTHYKKGYPNQAAMGKLSFDVVETKKLSPEFYFIVGKWSLIRGQGNLSGYFDLLLRKIRNRWFIISDHSS